MSRGSRLPGRRKDSASLKSNGVETTTRSLRQYVTQKGWVAGFPERLQAEADRRLAAATEAEANEREAVQAAIASLQARGVAPTAEAVQAENP